MPNLTITYCGMTLFDGDVEAFRWDDVPGQSVTVTGQLAKTKTAGNGLGAIADLISAASRKKTDTMIAEKKAAADVIEETDD